MKKTNTLAKCAFIYNLNCNYVSCQTCPYLKDYIAIMKNELSETQLLCVMRKTDKFIEVHNRGKN